MDLQSVDVPHDPLPAAMTPSPHNRHPVALIDTGRISRHWSETSLGSLVEDNDPSSARYTEIPPPAAASLDGQYLDLSYRPLAVCSMARPHPTWWLPPSYICVPIMVGRVDPAQRKCGSATDTEDAFRVKVLQKGDNSQSSTTRDVRDVRSPRGLGSARALARPFHVKVLKNRGNTELLKTRRDFCNTSGQRYGGNQLQTMSSTGAVFFCSPPPILVQKTQPQPTETKQSQRSKRASPAHGTSTVSWVFTMSTNAYSPQAHSPCLPSEEQGEWVWVPKTAMPSPQAGHLECQYATAPLFTPGFEDSSASPTTFSANQWNSLMMSGQMDNILFTSPSSSTINEFGTSFTGSPADALLEDFVHDGYVGGSTLFPEVALPQQDFISTDLNPYVDSSLFPAVDLNLNLDTLVADVATPFSPFGVALSPASSVHESSPTFSYSPPIFDSPFPPTTGASPNVTSPSTPQILSCSERNCAMTFDKVSGLKRHERKHRQPFRCDLCGKGHLDKRALGRHLWAKHLEYAQQHNTRSERIKCTYCDYEGRADNVARHMKRHTKKW
ncbi:hypothetical protein QBC36DRAFT_198352 [Triangularia setosa]|uniref:C2H2-type domain-containing protein n=1 Tax=Triangularia setosa TaxID=2587417 RepID=A0AAN6W006_9PEZI|nr:hypothetical protein QBC36DRAFT_198352 [Podospora setosa]